MSAGDEIADVVVVGGGLAGLTAAWRLRRHRVTVLEAADRPGGRILSLPRDPYWLNLGAHMFGEPGTPVGDLAAEMGLETRSIRGRLFGMVYGGRRVLAAPAEAYPFLLPMKPMARASLVRVGLALRLGSARAVRALADRPGETDQERSSRLLGFEENRTFADFLGTLHPQTAEILTAITERNGADPTEMTAGHALRSFTNVWSAHAPGRNLFGGSGRLPEALAAGLGGRLVLSAPVREVRRDGAGVAVRYQSGGEPRWLRARQAILATPAPVTYQIAPDLPPATRAALGRIRYGTFVAVAALTGETAAMPWDGTYAIAAPGNAFSVVFNQATTLHDDGARRPGGSLMLFRGARGAAELAALPPAEIERRFLADLVRLFPEAAGIVRDSAVRVWETGAPYTYPGRAALQPALTADAAPFALAGDYLDFPNMEAAVRSGEAAARAVAGRLAAVDAGSVPAAR